MSRIFKTPPLSIIAGLLAGMLTCALMPAAAQDDGTAAFDYFIGSWTCTSAKNSQVAKIFTPSIDGRTVTLNNPFVDRHSRLRAYTDVYTVRDDGSIVVRSSSTIGPVFYGTAPHGWRGSNLTFEGTSQDELGTVPTRMTYRRVSEAFFRRTIEFRRIKWEQTSSELCSRAG